MSVATSVASLTCRLRSVFLIAAVAISVVTLTTAQSERVIHVFGQTGDGINPSSGLVSDGQGALYGTTSIGGLSCQETTRGCGLVFRLNPPSVSGGAWSEDVLYQFSGNRDGGVPGAGSNSPMNLVLRNGKIYGTAFGGGQKKDGVVYELTPGTPWTETVLHTFRGAGDGAGPISLISYKNGLVGSAGAVLYALLPPSVQGGPWTEKVLHTFVTQTEGFGANAVVSDSTGTLYGTTQLGGPTGFGTVFKLTPPSGSGPWTLTTLYSFTRGTDGGLPIAGVVLDASGSLYGTTLSGGSPTCNCGTVFRLSPPSSGTGAWTLTTLYTFTGGADGSGPYGGVIFDSSGALYGTAINGGSTACQVFGSGCGVIFKLTPPATLGGSWSESTFYSFQGSSDGAQPTQQLLILNNKFFGVTSLGGASDDPGTAFEITP